MSAIALLRTGRLMCLVLIAECMCIMVGTASAAEIWVVMDRHHPISNVGLDIRVIELDAPARIQAELAARLPSDPVRAAAIVRQRLSEGGITLQQRLALAYQGIVDAWQLGITQIPAVLVDRRYVVYGEADVHHAVSLIEQHRKTHP